MNNFRPLLETLEELFGDEPFDPAGDELFKWFIYLYAGKGISVKALNTADFERFKKQLILLLDAVYRFDKDGG